LFKKTLVTNWDKIIPLVEDGIATSNPQGLLATNTKKAAQGGIEAGTASG